MGVMTATYGGIIRDLLGGQSPVILRREIYASAALAGAVVFVGLTALGSAREVAVGVGFAIALLIRAAALRYGWSLPSGALRRLKPLATGLGATESKRPRCLHQVSASGVQSFPAPLVAGALVRLPGDAPAALRAVAAAAPARGVAGLLDARWQPADSPRFCGNLHSALAFAHRIGAIFACAADFASHVARPFGALALRLPDLAPVLAAIAPDLAPILSPLLTHFTPVLPPILAQISPNLAADRLTDDVSSARPDWTFEIAGFINNNAWRDDCASRRLDDRYARRNIEISPAGKTTEAIPDYFAPAAVTGDHIDG